MAASLYDLVVNVSSNTVSLESGLSRVSDILGKQSQQWQSAVDRISGAYRGVTIAIGAVAGALGVASFGAAIKSVIDYADNLNDLSKKTGIAVETLGGLGYAAKQSGVDLETVAKGTSKLSTLMAEAAGGSDKAVAALKAVGISADELSKGLVPADQALLRIAEQFEGYADGPEKAALATSLFGEKLGSKLIPLLDEGGQKLREAIADWVKYGGITTETAQRADVFNDTLAKLQLIQGSLFRELASALLPTLQAIANIFVEAKTKGEGFKGVAEGVTVAVKSLAIAGIAVVEAFRAVGTSIGAVFAAFGQAITGDFKGAFATLKLGFTDVTASISTAIDRAKTVWSAGTADMAVSADRNLGKARAPIAQTAKAVDDLAERIKKLIKPFDDLVASIGREGVALDTQLRSLQRYGQETKELEAATVEYDLTLGKLAQQFQVLLAISPVLANAFAVAAKAQATHNDATRISIELEKQFIESQKQRIDSLVQGIDSINKQIEAENERGRTLGLTRAAIVDLALAQELANDVTRTTIEVDEATVRAQEIRIAKLRELSGLVASNDATAAARQGWTDLFNTIADRGAAFIEDFARNGSSAFRRLWEDFKSWALAALAKVAAQQIVISLAGAAGAPASGIASGALSGGGNNLLSNLFSTGGRTLADSFLSSLGAVGAGGSLGGGVIGAGIPGGVAGAFDMFGAAAPTFGALGTTIGTSFVTGLASPLATLSTALTSGAAAAGGFAAIAGAAVPVIGVALAAAAAFGAFNKKPSETRGQFGVSTGTGGFEDSRFTASAFGNLGFLDANTQQFSGEAAQAFNQIVAGALDAFETRYTSEQADRLAGILQSTTFPALEGTFSTEDFIKQYGGDILRQVVTAAFDVLDPAMASVVQGFQGTADEFSKFSNTLLGIYDASKDFDAEFRGRIVTALGDATQETADKVGAFVSIFASFGTAISGLGPQLQALDPSSITAFVDALGGAQAALNSFTYLNTNFLTSAQRVAQAQTQLNESFDALGIKVPETHQAFLDLLSSFDLTSESGRTLYASVVALAPLFVQVAGTADAAASAVRNVVALKPSLADIGRTAVETGNAIATAVTTINLAIADLQDAAAKAQAEFSASMAAINSIVSGSGGDFGSKIALRMSLIQEQLTKYQALLAQTQATNPYSPLMTAYQNILRELGKQNTGLAATLAQFTVLKAQYGATIAEQLVELQTQYNAQKVILAGNVAALAALDANFNTQWDAIIKGVSTGVNGTISELDRLRKSILDYVNGLKISDLSPFTPAQKLAQAASVYSKDLVLAQSGDLEALGRITKDADAYLKLFSSSFGTASAEYIAFFNTIISQLSELGTAPASGGAPVGGSAAIEAVLPVTGKIMSSDDATRIIAGQDAVIKRLEQKIEDLITALAESNSDDAEIVANATTSAAQRSAAIAVA
jgi:hypothetical protein